MHVRLSRGGAPEPVADIYRKMIPQDLAVVSLLADMGNGEVQNADEDLLRVRTVMSNKWIMRSFLVLAVFAASFALQFLPGTVRNTSRDSDSPVCPEQTGSTSGHTGTSWCPVSVKRMSGPILILTSAWNPFSGYYAEILSN